MDNQQESWSFNEEPVSRQLKRKEVKTEDRWQSVQIEIRWGRKSEMGFYGEIQAQDQDSTGSSNTHTTLNNADNKKKYMERNLYEFQYCQTWATVMKSAKAVN